MSSKASHPQIAPGFDNEVLNDIAYQEENPIDWGYWQSVNPDLVAWVVVPGTGINQPVVQAHDDSPQHYLSHDVYGDWNYCGCPYIDAGCTRGVDSLNAVIFGHNISTPPSMFHDIELYHDASYAQEHSEVIIYTPGEIRHYKVFGVETVPGNAPVKRVEFDNLKDYREYRAARLEASGVKLASIDGTSLKKMVSLVSCSYYFNPSNERTIVYALES